MPSKRCLDLEKLWEPEVIRGYSEFPIVLRQEEDTFYVFSAQHKNSTKTLTITVLKTGVTESVSVTQPTHQGN